MTGDRPLAEMLISDVLARWPKTAEVFHHHNMACVGCPVADYYSIRDAAQVYGLSSEDFLAELTATIDGSPS